MKHLIRKYILFFIILIVFLGILLTYMYGSPRANRMTSDEEYIEQLRVASIGKKVAGLQQALEPIQEQEEASSSFFQSILSWLGL